MSLRRTLAGLSVAYALLAGNVHAGPSSRLPALAGLQPQSGTLAEPDLMVLPGNNVPPVRLTVDARDGLDAVENVKAPIGWVGPGLLAYVSASGQDIGAEPVYVQRTDSVRRVAVALAAVAAQPAPIGAGLAILTAGPHAGVEVLDFGTRRTIRWSARLAPAMVPTSFGAAAIDWSPDASQVAAAWQAEGGVELAVCSVRSRSCHVGTHTSDLGWRSVDSELTLALGWLSDGAILVSATHPFGPTPSVLAEVRANRPEGGAKSALAAGFRTHFPQVLAVSVDPSGRSAALVEQSALDGMAALQIVALRGNHVGVPEYTVVGGSAGIDSPGSIRPFAIAPPAQAWSGSRLLYAETVMDRRGAVRRLGAWYGDAATGRQVEVMPNLEWAALRPGGAATALRRTAGSCPNPPLAAIPPAPAAATTVRQAVDFYRAVRQQAYRLADGSCVQAAATGPALAAIHATLDALHGGWAAVPADITPYATTPLSDRATETATVTQGEIGYRRGRVVRRLRNHAIHATYRLGLRHAGKGSSRLQWIVVSVGP